MASADAIVCAICQADIEQQQNKSKQKNNTHTIKNRQADIEGGNEAFACGHVLHAECFAEYRSMVPVAADDLQCPTCKLSANMLKSSEANLLGTLLDNVPFSQDRQPDTIDIDASAAGSGLSPAERIFGLAPQPDYPAAAPVADVIQVDIPAGQPDRIEVDADASGSVLITRETSTIAVDAGASGSGPITGETSTIAVDAPDPIADSGCGGSLFPKFPEPTVYCTTCGSLCVISSVRILSKREGSWRCLGCRSKITSLYRGFGGWPVAGFTALTKSQQQEFYAEVKDKTAEEIVGKATQLLTKSETHVKYYAESGRHLPLSVWATKGFDIDRIRTLTPQSDIQMHNILGECYRVQLLTTGRSGEEALKREDVNAARGTKRAAAGTAAAAGGKKSKVEDAKSSSSQDSSSSSSSSSSSGGKSKKKNNKKGKKDKKDKKSKKHKKSKKSKKSEKKAKETKEVQQHKKQEQKEAAKVARAASKAEEQGKAKALKAKEALAKQAETKLTVAKNKLEAALCDPSTLRVPAEISALAKSVYEKIKFLHKECVAVLADPEHQGLSFSSIKEVQAVIEQAKNAEGLVTTLTKTMSKFAV